MQRDVYTHGYQPAVIEQHARRTVETSAAFLLPHLNDSMRILDVGCGPGSITAGLARWVPDGEVVGIEVVPGVLETARRHCAETGADNVTFREASVYDLPFDSGSFDVVYGHQVLQHLTDPVAALCEMRRVVRHGGLVAVRDSDYYTMSRTPESPLMDRWRDLYRRVARHNGAEPDAGRHLYRWLKTTGFTEITMSASCQVMAGKESRRNWGESWAKRCLTTDFASQAVAYGYATEAELGEIADDWRAWANDPDGYFHYVCDEGLAVRSS